MAYAVNGISYDSEDLCEGNTTIRKNKINTNESDNNSIGLSNQVFGNRCGHIKSKPRLFIDKTRKKRHIPIISRAKANLKKCYKDPYELYFSQTLYNDEKINKNGCMRKRRSEVAETITYRFGQALLDVTNVGFQVIGYEKKGYEFNPNNINNSFHFYTVKSIAKKCGVSYHQALAVIKIFKKYDYIELLQNKKIDGKEYKSGSPIIMVKIGFFVDLGIPKEDVFREIRRQKNIIKILDEKRFNKEFIHRVRRRSYINSGRLLDNLNNTLDCTTRNPKENIEAIHESRIRQRNYIKNKISPKMEGKAAEEDLQTENQGTSPYRQEEQQASNIRDFTGIASKSGAERERILEEEQKNKFSPMPDYIKSMFKTSIFKKPPS